MRWKGNISMNIRCKVKIPEGNNKFMLNFKKEWAEIMMAADENHCVEAVPLLPDIGRSGPDRTW